MSDSIKRIVVKIGTSSLINSNGEIKLSVINKLAKVLSFLNQNHYQVLLVTSGAVGVGMNKLHIIKRPTEIGKLQALSAIGQSELMHIYEDAFSNDNQTVAQLLLTRDVVDYPKSRKNVLSTINTLLDDNIIPIVNENDAVSVDEFNHQTTFGENDQLAAITSTFIDADMLIILSDINGLYSADPKKYPDAKLLSWVPNVDKHLMKSAGGHGSQFGTGGMTTKLRAAKIMLEDNKKMVILNGSNPEIIRQLLNGQNVGTYFSAKRPKERNNE